MKSCTECEYVVITGYSYPPKRAIFFYFAKFIALSNSGILIP